MKKTRRSYCDLLVIPENIRNFIELVNYAKYLGFKKLGVSLKFLFEKIDEETSIDEFVSLVKKLEESLGINIIFKVPLEYNKKKIAKILDPLKTIVYDYAENEESFRRLLKTEANVLSISIENFSEIMKKSNLNLLLQTDKAVEIIIKPLWMSQLPDFQKIIKANHKTFRLLNKELPIYIVSGAESMREMRNPYQIRSFLMLLGVKDKYALKLIEERPSNVIEMTKPIILVNKK